MLRGDLDKVRRTGDEFDVFFRDDRVAQRKLIRTTPRVGVVELVELDASQVVGDIPTGGYSIAVGAYPEKHTARS